MIKKLFIAVVLLSVFPFSSSQGHEVESRFASFGDIRVHYHSIGHEQTALVFVHGWACSAEFWVGSASAFHEYRVVTIDLPGHGRSDKPRADYTMDYFARSIAAVLDDANIKSAVLVGHSMGTQVVRQFYRLYPSRTLGLVSVDGALVAGTEDLDRFVAPFREDYFWSAARLVEKMLQPIRNQTLKNRIRSTMLAAPDYVGLSAMTAMADRKVWTNDPIDVPLLVIVGELWGYQPGSEAAIRSIARNLEFQMWPGASHFLMMEQPAVFNEAIRAFIVKNALLHAEPDLP